MYFSLMLTCSEALICVLTLPLMLHLDFHKDLVKDARDKGSSKVVLYTMLPSWRGSSTDSVQMWTRVVSICCTCGNHADAMSGPSISILIVQGINASESFEVEAYCAPRLALRFRRCLSLIENGAKVP